MNFASWVILGVVAVIVGLAIKATFFKKASRGGCCDTGDAPLPKGAKTTSCHCSSAPNCAGCDGCAGTATTRNTLQATYKPVR